MNTVGWIVFLLYFFFFNIGWIFGLRHYLEHKGGFMYSTAATTMLMTLTSVVFLYSNINKLHLLWLTPFYIFISGILNDIIFSIPIIGILYKLATTLFARIATIGVRTCKTPDDYMSSMMAENPSILNKTLKDKS